MNELTAIPEPPLPIHTLRGKPVVLDSDLAVLYGVQTRVLNKAVKRNAARFPADFLFQLTSTEFASLMFQNGTSSSHGGRRKLPWAFTEHGAIMAATILNSPRAVAMSVYVVRAFVRMREELLARTELEKRLAQIEHALIGHDAALKDLYQKIKPLLLPPPAPPKPEIGFHAVPKALHSSAKPKSAATKSSGK
ncbi:MAG: ORF6N domain-containing protein [Verrucomicrobia bacterium]|nr:ORF6N domain-containing protein [Verrucomicrobiota bacterium]